MHDLHSFEEELKLRADQMSQTFSPGRAKPRSTRSNLSNERQNIVSSKLGIPSTPQAPDRGFGIKSIDKFNNLSKVVVSGLCSLGDVIQWHPNELSSCDLTAYTAKANAGLMALMEISNLYGWQTGEIEGLKNEIARLRANQKG